MTAGERVGGAASGTLSGRGALCGLLDAAVAGKPGSCEARGLRSRLRLRCEGHRLASSAHRGLRTGRLPGITLGRPGTWFLAGHWVSSTCPVPGLQGGVL